MGAVKTDITKQDAIYARVTYSDPQCVKGLIKNRCKFNPVATNYPLGCAESVYTSSGDVGVNDAIINIYLDLDRLLKMVDMNDKQTLVINAYMTGLSTRDISELYTIPSTTAERILDQISNEVAMAENYLFKKYIKKLKRGGK